MVQLASLINWVIVLLAFLEYVLLGTLWFAALFKNNPSLKKREEFVITLEENE